MYYAQTNKKYPNLEQRQRKSAAKVQTEPQIRKKCIKIERCYIQNLAAKQLNREGKFKKDCANFVRTMSRIWNVNTKHSEMEVEETRIEPNCWATGRDVYAFVQCSRKRNAHA